MTTLKENCKNLKAKFRQQYPNVLEEDLQCGNGNNKDEMFQRLQQKLGKSSDEIIQAIRELSL
jgi:hypothetical protein